MELDIAGPGSRMIAAIIDTAIQFAALLLFSMVMVASGVDGGGAVAVAVVLFLLLWGYYPVSEALWNGQTIGKRAQRLRVVRTDGQPVTIGPVLVRNLVRIVDFLPAYYVVGLVTMVLTKRSQRLGDLAAGTVVARDRPLPPPVPLAWAPSHHAAVDTAGLTEREYELIRGFLERRHALAPAARQELAARIAEVLRSNAHGAATGLPDEAFIEAAAHAYRARFSPTPPPRPDAGYASPSEPGPPW